MLVSSGISGILSSCCLTHRTVRCWQEHFCGHPMAAPLATKLASTTIRSPTSWRRVEADCRPSKCSMIRLLCIRVLSFRINAQTVAARRPVQIGLVLPGHTLSLPRRYAILFHMCSRNDGDKMALYPPLLTMAVYEFVHLHARNSLK